MATDATTSQTALGETATTAVPNDLRAGKAVMIGVVYLLVQVVVGLIAGVAVVVYYSVANGGRPPRITPQLLAGITLPAAAIAVAIGGLAVFGVTAVVLRRAEGGLRSIGCCSATSRAIWMSVAGGVLLAGAFLVVQLLYPPPVGQKWGPLATAAATGGWQRGLWAAVALLAPPIEEFLFRGVLWTGLRRSFGGVVAAAIVTVLFVGSHATETLNYWPAWLAISVLGVGTLAQRSRTGSLVPPLALHGAYNASLVLAVYLGTA